jgi:alpha-galactosidase
MLENLDYRLVFDTENGCFCLDSLKFDGWSINNAYLGLQFEENGRRYSISSEKWFPVAETIDRLDTTHGAVRQLQMDFKIPSHPLDCRLMFQLCDNHPIFLWKMRVHNNGGQPIKIHRCELLKLSDRLSGNLTLGNDEAWENMAFYANGWQSWSLSASYSAHQKAQRTRLQMIQTPLVVNAGTPQPRGAGHFSADFYGVLGDRSSRRAALVGFESQQQHFGTVEACLKAPVKLELWANGDAARLEPGCDVETDNAVIYAFSLDQDDPLAPYLDAVARYHNVTADGQIPAGWCSWYQFYNKVTADQIIQNLEAVTRLKSCLPLKLMQIDDGFQAEVGDWLAFKPTFPDGVGGLAKQIGEGGFTPGLWLAPFIVHPKSDLAKNYPELILRSKFGLPVNAGFIWDVFTQSLDLTHPGAQEYCCRVIETAVGQWGFPYLKLDFLYAGALQGQRYDNSKTRAQILRDGLSMLRDAAGPETYLLGCGMPLGSGIGLVDAMRIGADVSGDWLPQYFGVKYFFQHEPHMPSVRNAIQNILTRASLHRRWWVNDPDCLLVRSDTRLTLDEVRSLATVIGMTGGSLLLSDDLTELPEDRRGIAEVLLPVIGQRAEVVDWFDRTTPSFVRLALENATGSYFLLAWFNWDDGPSRPVLRPSDFNLPNHAYHLREFWSGCNSEMCEETPFDQAEVAAHGVLLLAARKISGETLRYLGSDLHFSQGNEVRAVELGKGFARFQFELPRQASGTVDLWFPGPPTRVLFDGKPAHWQNGSVEGVYTVGVGFDHRGVLEIYY